MRAVPGRVTSVVAAAVLGMGVPSLGMTAIAGAALAAPAGPFTVGQCFNLSEEELAEVWIEAEPVECSTPHTVQVTSVTVLAPADDPVDVATRECGPLGVWNELGVNRPVAGIIRQPLRIEPRALARRGAEPTLACAAAAVSWDARGESAVVPVTRSLDGLASRTRAGLRYCTAASGRRPALPGPTVPCSARPRWEVSSWIVGTAFFDDYPGRVTLRDQARRLCGVGERFVIPARVDWEQGLPRTWCVSRIPGD